MSLIFGSGVCWGINAAANSTPFRLGIMQDVAFNFDFTLKELRGMNQLPLDIRRADGKMTGKAKFANFNSSMMNDMFFGNTKTAGLLLSALAETSVIPATPFQITVVNGATFDTDLGVTNVATGTPMLKVASAPATGQYSVSAGGVYTFAAVDTGKSMAIDYLYTATTGGNRIALTNNLMGTTPSFMGVWTAQVGGKTCTLKLNQCTSSKLDFATKLSDYSYPEFDFEAMDNGSGSLGVLSIAD